MGADEQLAGYSRHRTRYRSVNFGIDNKFDKVTKVFFFLFTPFDLSCLHCEITFPLNVMCECYKNYLTKCFDTILFSSHCPNVNPFKTGLFLCMLKVTVMYGITYLPRTVEPYN